MTRNEIGELRAEIEALRGEVAALRADHASAGRPSAAAPANDTAQSAKADITDQLRTLAREISAFAQGAENDVVAHPLTSVLAALVLGTLIGRVLPRS